VHVLGGVEVFLCACLVEGFDVGSPNDGQPVQLGTEGDERFTDDEVRGHHDMPHEVASLPTERSGGGLVKCGHAFGNLKGFLSALANHLHAGP